jgi:hypothetical protein
VTARFSLRRAPTPRAATPPATTPPSTTPSTFTGSLAVLSRPSGARVFVDDRAVGTTPVTLRGIRAGSHVVRLELAGYRRWSTSATVVAGEENRVAASLERQ